jgi:hypothetical protein
VATSKGKVVKANLFTLCQTLFPPPVLVSYGLPATDQPNDIVAICEAGTADTMRANQEAKTYGPRTREETTFVSILISSWRGTMDQQIVSELVFDAMGDLEDALRTDPTIGGAVREANIDSWELTETDFNDLPAGRYAEISVIVRARHRI